MKEIFFLTLSLVLMSFLTNAQSLNENKFLLGGSFGYKDVNNNSQISIANRNAKTASASATLLLGYFPTRQFMVGLAYEYNWKVTGNGAPQYNGDESIDHLISPLARFYINSPLFIHSQINWGSSKYFQSDSFSNGSAEAKYTVLGGGVGIGYDIMLSEAIQIEPLLMYSMNNYKEKEGTSGNHKKSNLGFNIGLIYRFLRKN